MYLKWLEYERSLVCKSMRTEGTVHSVLTDNSVLASENTKRTVITLIINTVFQSVSQQIANEIEQLSNPSTSQKDTRVSPSDETTLHRICGGH